MHTCEEYGKKFPTPSKLQGPSINTFVAQFNHQFFQILLKNFKFNVHISLVFDLPTAPCARPHRRKAVYLQALLQDVRAAIAPQKPLTVGVLFTYSGKHSHEPAHGAGASQECGSLVEEYPIRRVV